MNKTQNIDINRKDWESTFFKKNFYDLQINKNINFEEIKSIINSLDFDLIETRVSTKLFKNIEILEDLGFRTVDSRITFLTKIDINDSKFSFETNNQYQIRKYKSSDLPIIKLLAHQNLTNNPQFISRYKNLNYFNKQDAQQYYDQWIEFSVKDHNSSIVVSTHKDQVVGFFIIQVQGNHLNYPLVKGILTAVEKDHQNKKLHLAMQTELFKEIESSTFFLDNTTQISNIATIKNHVTSNRKLHDIYLTMLLKKEDL